MTTLGISLFFMACKSTLILLLAWSLIRLVRWRKWGLESAIILPTLVLLMVLPVTLWVNLPWQWNWPTPDMVQHSGSSEAIFAVTESNTREETSGISLMPILGWLQSVQLESDSSAPNPVWSIFAWCYLGLVAITAINLFRSNRHLGRFRSRLKLIQSPELQAEFDALCDRIGWFQPIQLAECDEPGLAATLGHRLPLIVLPPEWRNWSVDERRTVLAHELAHIHHRDFRLRWWGQIALVLHPYQPLVWWLQRAIRWQQEIRADGLAAQLFGNRTEYRKSLVLLALRLPTEGNRMRREWMPAMQGGDLLRRLEMLRNTEVRTMSRWIRGSMAFAVAMACLALSTIQGPAATPDQPAPKNWPEYDLSYLAPQNTGMLAIRPAQLLSQPGTESFAKKYNAILREMLANWKIELPDALRIENIEQIVAEFQITTEGTGQPNSRSLHIGSSGMLIRMKQSFDWLAFLKTLPVKITEKKVGEVTLHQLKFLEFVAWPEMAIFLPDDRSLVFTSFKEGENLKERFAQQNKTRREKYPQWKTLDQSAIVFHIDNYQANYSKKFDKDLSLNPDLAKLLNSIQSLSLGIELGDDRPVRVLAETVAETEMPQFEKQLNHFLSLGRKAIEADGELIHPLAAKLFLQVTEKPRMEIKSRTLDFAGYPSLRVSDFTREMEAKFTSTGK